MTIEFKGIDFQGIKFAGHFKTNHTRKSRIERQFRSIFNINPADCQQLSHKVTNNYYKAAYSFTFEKPKEPCQTKPQKRSQRLLSALLVYLQNLCKRIAGAWA